jgi:hypothetical protein
LTQIVSRVGSKEWSMMIRGFFPSLMRIPNGERCRWGIKGIVQSGNAKA